jgi:hypothetical protein
LDSSVHPTQSAVSARVRTAGDVVGLAVRQNLYTLEHSVVTMNKKVDDVQVYSGNVCLPVSDKFAGSEVPELLDREEDEENESVVSLDFHSSGVNESVSAVFLDQILRRADSLLGVGCSSVDIDRLSKRLTLVHDKYGNNPGRREALDASKEFKWARDINQRDDVLFKDNGYSFEALAKMKLDSSLNNRLSTKNLYFLRALDEDDDATGDWDRLFCMAINGIDIATAPCFEERTDLDRSLTPAYLACQNAVNMEMLSYWVKEYVVILSRDVLKKTKDKVHLSDLSGCSSRTSDW